MEPQSLIILAWLDALRHRHAREIMDRTRTRTPDQEQPAVIYRGLAEACRRHFGRGRMGRPTHPATMTRWILKGVTLKSGETLRLAAKRLPGRWVVSDEAIEEFLDQLTRDHLDQPEPVAPRTTTKRRRAAERAERELAKAGI